MRILRCKCNSFLLIKNPHAIHLIFFNYVLLFRYLLFEYFCGEMDKDLDKKYYRIREVVMLVDLPASTLRFWESQFDILRPKRSAKGTRLYTPADVENLRIIKYLIKDKGLKIEAAQEQLRKNRENVSRRHRAISRLEGVRGQLVLLLKSLSSRNHN